MSDPINQAAILAAAIYRRSVSGTGASYSLLTASTACYYYLKEPTPEEVTTEGTIPAMWYYFVFPAGTSVPDDSCIVSGGAGYMCQGIGIQPGLGPGGLGGYVWAKTHKMETLPPGVTV